jgi:pimeloyl-ACP methyl ester carboxylesterase
MSRPDPVPVERRARCRRPTRCSLSGVRTGPGILLVHGIGVSGRYFVPLADELGATHAVVTVDLAGFGRSDRPRPALSIAEHADVVAATMDQLGLREAVLVGHSMGAQVVTELAARQPSRARAVVLIGPVVDPAAPRSWHQACRLALNSLREPARLVALCLADYLRGGPRSYWQSLPHMLRYPICARLALVSAPVLLVRGQRDPIAPAGFVRELAASAPSARLLEVPGAAHLAMATHPQIVAAGCRGPW